MSASKDPGTERFDGTDAVKAMLGRTDLSDEIIDRAARSCGWPDKDPHPFLVAERVERIQPK